MKVKCPECGKTFEAAASLINEGIKCPGCGKELRAPKNQGVVDDGNSVLNLIPADDVSLGIVETVLDVGGDLLTSAAERAGDVADCAGDVIGCIGDIL